MLYDLNPRSAMPEKFVTGLHAKSQQAILRGK
jgi:hypothetical protein